MSINYSRTQEGGIVVDIDRIDDDDVLASQIESIHQGAEKNVVYQDGGSLGFFDSIQIEGKYAYTIREGGGSIAILDVSNPLSPEVVSEFSDSAIDSITDLDVSGDTLFVSGSIDGNPGVATIDASDLESLSVIGTLDKTEASFPNSDPIASVLIKGDFAYSGGELESEFVAYDVSDKSNISVLGTEDNTFGESVFIFTDKYTRDDVIYGVNTAGLAGKLYDISDRTAISEIDVASTEFAGSSFGGSLILDDYTIAVGENAVASNFTGDQTNQEVVSEITIDDTAIGVEEYDRQIFVGGESSVTTLNGSDPENLFVQEVVTDSGFDDFDGADMDSLGDILFIAGSGPTTGLTVLI